MKEHVDEAVICVVGLGYVGLPLAQSFSKSQKLVAFDINNEVIENLRKESDNGNLILTNNPEDISEADFIIIAVPTPVNKFKEPDLSYVKEAAATTGRYMKKGSVVILESTVYPGVTEDIICPILEKESGYKCGRDFGLAYCPERINPGDKEHTIDNTTKIVSGKDSQTAQVVAMLYEKLTPHIYRASSIRAAEAAKVIENIQRDLNIALMNELAIIFGKMDLNTNDVIDAAATKWNFHRYSPGLVGGHCIPVDPYYLVYKARDMDYHPQVILAGRAINDSMPKYIVEITIKELNSVGKPIKGSKILIMGLTYKENVSDIRETPVKGIIKELKEYGVDIYGCDPHLSGIEKEFGIKEFEYQILTYESISQNKNSIPIHSRFDAIIFTVAHDIFKRATPHELKSIMLSDPILIDVRNFFDAVEVKREGINYRSL